MRPELKLLMENKDVTFTSDVISLECAKRCELLFTRSNHTAGNTVFSVEVSLDQETWITYNKLIDNVANTNVQDLTRVASATLSSNTSKVYAMDLVNDSFRFMRVTATRTTDGKATVKALIDYAN